MSASLDRPAPYYTDPGPDQRQQTLTEAIDAVIAIIGRDGDVDDTERGEVQRLMSVLQSIALARTAQQQGGGMQMPGNEAEPFGQTADSEDAQGEGPAPGAEYAGQGY